MKDKETCGESCSDVCNKKNKFKKFYKIEDSCEVSRILLTITLSDRDIIYTVTNTGTLTLCNNIVICSKLFRKQLVIENNLLLENSNVQLIMSMNDIVNPQINETEKARAYVKLKDRVYIASDLIELSFENGNGVLSNPISSLVSNPIKDASIGGVYIVPNVFIENFNNPRIYYFYFVNSGVSSSDLTNVRFHIGYSGDFVFSRIVIQNWNIRSKFQFIKTVNGIEGYIPLWKKYEVYSFTFEISYTAAETPLTIPISVKFTADQEFSQFTNYFSITDVIQF